MRTFIRPQRNTMYSHCNAICPQWIGMKEKARHSSWFENVEKKVLEIDSNVKSFMKDFCKVWTWNTSFASSQLLAIYNTKTVEKKSFKSKKEVQKQLSKDEHNFLYFFVSRLFCLSWSTMMPLVVSWNIGCKASEFTA